MNTYNLVEGSLHFLAKRGVHKMLTVSVAVEKCVEHL